MEFNRQIFTRKTFRVAKISRLIAKAIDLFIAAILILPFYPLGVFLAIAYMIFSDSIQNGQSIGKKFIGFSVVSVKDGKPCTLKQSAIRNLPIIVPIFFMIIPFWGWFISVIIGLPLIMLEVYLLLSLDSGYRMGDVMADTTVVVGNSGKVGVKAIKAGVDVAYEKINCY